MASGKVSWFGGPNDSSDSGRTASGGTTATPGVALYNRATLGGYYRVRFPNGRTVVLKQTDIGPAPWTGRKVDVTYSALRQAGYNEHNFPTDATVQYQYLGKHPPKGGGGAQPTQQGQPGTTTVTKTITPGVDNSALRNQLKFQYLSQAPAQPFSAKNLTPGPVPSDPLKALSAPPSTAPDPVKYLGQANARSNSLLALAGQLSQAQDVAPTTKTVTQHTPGSSGGGGGGGAQYMHPIGGHYSIERIDNGVDFKTNPGTPIRAITSGVVVSTQGPFPGGSIVIKQANGKYVYYGHIADQNKEVRPGQRVRPGQIIARSSRRPPGAEDIPGHVEIGYARPDGSIFLRGHAEGATGWGNEFARNIRGLR